jgi:hypothetical protein
MLMSERDDTRNEASKNEGIEEGSTVSAPSDDEPAFSEVRSSDGSQGSVVDKSETRIDEKMSNAPLPWPPNPEDLTRLYVDEHLSAMKIAQRYGLKYASPKTAESTVLYQLKKAGIMRRDAAEHVRKVTEEMVDEWVKKYQAGESLKEIAGDAVDPVTVFNHLKKKGLVLRDRIEAQIASVTKYEKRPFSGDAEEKAYLMGLRYGDLDVVRHGRAIRVRVSTTHVAMADLFESLFSPSGHVARYPREAKFTGFEWTLECDLDQSFEFLLARPTIRELEMFTARQFAVFLAGFFDAEGSIYLHAKSSGLFPEAHISNKDRELLELIAARMATNGISSSLALHKQSRRRLGYNLEGTIWRLQVWRHDSVKKLLQDMMLRHTEKIGKGQVALAVNDSKSRLEKVELVRKWDSLVNEIESKRLKFIEAAKESLGLRLGSITS